MLDSSRQETDFTQEFKDRLQALGISLTFLPNNGPAYWAVVDPIRQSSAADLLVFGLLMVVALVMSVFLYIMARRRDYAILRALGVPARQANGQLALPLLLLGGLGILTGGLPSWNYALSQAKASLSTIPTPGGITPSADLSLAFLAGFCAAIFLLLAVFSWLGVSFLTHQPILELLQGQTTRARGIQKRTSASASSKPKTSLRSSLDRTVIDEESTRHVPPVVQAVSTAHRKYNPSSLSHYVIRHLLRSRLKSVLTVAIALGFILASGWIRQTMERSRIEIERLYDTTVVEADVLLADPTIAPGLGALGKGSGFAYLKTIDGVLNSGFVKSSLLEADTAWPIIRKLDPPGTINGIFPVYAYDNPDAFYSGLTDPNSLVFAEGWDMDRFAQPRTLKEIQKDGIPALFPASLLAQLKLEVGETVRITDQFGNTYPCVIVGQYLGGRATTAIGGKIPWLFSPTNSILITLSSLESMERSQTRFTVAHFTLDPAKNRQLPQFRTDMEAIMKAYGAGISDLRMIVWYEELRIVVAQLEKNISLLSVLYPVVIAVSVLIGALLCFLLLLQTAKEAAILRVLGTTRSAVRLALITEPLILSIIGVITGLGISRFLWMTSDLAPAVPLWTGAGLYLAGVLAGLVAGAISVTHKKPIELLTSQRISRGDPSAVAPPGGCGAPGKESPPPLPPPRGGGGGGFDQKDIRMPELKLENVSYQYKGGDRKVVNGVTCRFEGGKLNAVVGPSGSGKTTLLSLIAGLDQPTQGQISIDGEVLASLDLDQYRRERLDDFSSFPAFSPLTALENVCFPMQLNGVSKEEIRVKAKSLLASVGITEEKFKRYPANLSGGEQQRVAIARTLATGAHVLLADEPIGNLDKANGAIVIEILGKLAHEGGYCIIIVTHDPSIAERSDKVQYGIRGFHGPFYNSMYTLIKQVVPFLF